MPATPTADNEHRDERPRGAGGRRAAPRPVGGDPRPGEPEGWNGERRFAGQFGRPVGPEPEGPAPGRRSRLEERRAARQAQAAGEPPRGPHGEFPPGEFPPGPGPRPERPHRPDDDADDDAPAVPVAPVRRLLSLVIAGFAVLVTAALVFGAQTTRSADAVVVFGMQALFVVVWTVASRPPAPRIVAGVGLLVAAGTDIAAVLVHQASLEPLAYLTAAGFVASVIGQLVRPAGRIRVTESLGSSLVVVVGVVSLATLIELTRHAKGAQALVACMSAAGLAVAVARLVDTVLPVPRIAPQVPRGGLGVVLGAMVGTGVAAIAGYYLAGLETDRAAIAGLVTAVVAVMVDLSVGYAEASRHLEGEEPALWLARHMQGPLGALAFAAPVAYTSSVLLLGLQ